jgi:N-acetylmuramoyl-L-alanine amidase
VKNKRMYKLLSLLVITLILFMNSSIVFAADTTRNITIYFANSDWRYTPVSIQIPSNEKEPYLYALNMLVEGKNLPQGSQNEFPTGTRVKSFNVKNGIAYVDMDKVLIKKLTENNLSTDVAKDILSYNIWSFDPGITDIVFSFENNKIDKFNEVKKSDFFRSKENKQLSDEINKKIKDLQEKFRNMTSDEVSTYLETSRQNNLSTQGVAALSYIATVVVDPGHGGSDPGAVGTYSGSTYYEKTINLAVGLALKNDLVSRNFNVLMTRTGDTNPTLTQRYSLANNNGANLFVSVHHNSVGDTSVDGSTVIYPNNHDQTLSQTLANLVNNQIYSDTFLYIYRAPYADDINLAVLRSTTMPAILTETGFMSNSFDLSHLIISSNQTAIGNAISYAIWSWFMA